MEDDTCPDNPVTPGTVIYNLKKKKPREGGEIRE
jgi:hypothetical protein